MEQTNKTKADLNKAILTFCIVEATWQSTFLELVDVAMTNSKHHNLDRVVPTLLCQCRSATYELDVAFNNFVKRNNCWHDYVNIIESCIELGLSAVTQKEEIISFVPPPYMGDYLLGKTDSLSKLLSNYIEFASDPVNKQSAKYQTKLMDYQNAFSYFIKAVYDKRMEL